MQTVGTGVADHPDRATFRHRDSDISEIGLDTVQSLGDVEARRLVSQLATVSALPTCPWAGMSVRLAPLHHAAPQRRDDPTLRAAREIRAAAAGRRRIAVLCAGGLADLVLVRLALRHARDHELVIVVPERADVHGDSIGIGMTGFLARRAIGVDVVVVERAARDRARQRVWRPAGPATCAEIDVASALLAAQDCGADVLWTAPVIETRGVRATRATAALAARHHVAAERDGPADQDVRRRIRQLFARQPWYSTAGHRLPAVHSPLSMWGNEGGLSFRRRRDGGVLGLVAAGERGELAAEARRPAVADAPRTTYADLTGLRGAGLLAPHDPTGVDPDVDPGVGAMLGTVESWLRLAEQQTGCRVRQ